MKALLSGIVALFSAGALAAQQHQHGAPAPARSPAPCTQASTMPQGHMMPGMMQHGGMPVGGMQVGERGGMSGDMSGMDMALMDVMHQTMLFAPDRVLQQDDALDLSDNQRDQIQERGRDWATKSRALGPGELRTLFNADSPDLPAVRAAAEKIFALHVDHVSAAAAVRAILTVEQRDHVIRSACEMAPK